MLADYAGMRIVRHPMQPLQARVFELRHNFTAYDAMYVALAETYRDDDIADRQVQARGPARDEHRGDHRDHRKYRRRCRAT